MGPTRPIQSVAGSASDAGTRMGAPDDDAGIPDSVAPTCDATNGWQLAPGFVLGQRVDYVEDRNDQRIPPRVSSAGTACATAKDPASCQTDLALPTSIGRLLVTTTGDDVRFWPGQVGSKLLGAIDTAAEALWIASLNYELPCTATATRVSDGFVVDGLSGYVFSCMSSPDMKPMMQTVRAKVHPDGLFELLTPAPMDGCGTAF